MKKRAAYAQWAGAKAEKQSKNKAVGSACGGALVAYHKYVLQRDGGRERGSSGMVQRSDRLGGRALRHYFACRLLTAATLRGDAELELDVIKAHAGTDMAGNLSVGNAAADTDNHGNRRQTHQARLAPV